MYISTNAHNNMATVKKSCCRNIINKKSIEEKKVDEIFLIAAFFSSGRGESKCVGSVHYVSGTRVTEFDFLDEVFRQWMLTYAEFLLV